MNQIEKQQDRLKKKIGKDKYAKTQADKRKIFSQKVLDMQEVSTGQIVQMRDDSAYVEKTRGNFKTPKKSFLISGFRDDPNYNKGEN